MGKKIIQFAAILFAAVICLSGVVSAADAAEQDVIRVGLFYGSSALPGANLLNDVGTGYRFGYLDGDARFCPVGSTGESAISVVKTQNVYYGKVGDSSRRHTAPLRRRRRRPCRCPAGFRPG